MDDQQARLNALVRISSDWFWELDAQLRFTLIAGQGMRAIGLDQEKLLGLRRDQWPTYFLLSPSEEEFERLRAERKPYRDVRGVFRLDDGSEVFVSINGEPFFAADGSFAGYRGITRNVTREVEAERALRASEAAMRAVVEAAPSALLMVDAQGRIMLVNSQLERLFGYSRDELRGRSLEMLMPPRYAEGEAAKVAQYLRATAADVIVRRDVPGQRKDGTLVHTEVRLSPIATEQGAMMLASITDVTARKTVEDNLQRLAHYDNLTGATSRAHFFERLNHAVARARRHGTTLGLLYLDLDRFKQVNDELGHAAGDGLLVAFAGRIRMNVREVDTVARLGGDEFAVLLEDVQGAANAGAVAQKIVEAMRQPFLIGDHSLYVHASIGAALLCAGDATPQDFVARADAALYAAKRAGRNTYRIAEPAHAPAGPPTAALAACAPNAPVAGPSLRLASPPCAKSGARSQPGLSQVH
ncbi:MAG: diguanylate cyclase domain-containing protein [Burkholderiales bacterium]